MKARFVVLPALLCMVLVGAGWAQHNHQMHMQSDSSGEDMSKMMGAPAFTKALDGVTVTVWLIPQEEHKKMMQEHMKEMSHDMSGMHHNAMKSDSGMSAGMEKGMMKDMMSGTHHIVVALTGAKESKDLENATVSVKVKSPGGKSSDVKLRSMRGHFGGGVTLDDKGQYTFALHIMAGEKMWMPEFEYTAK